MKNILTLLFTIFSVAAFSQYYNGTEYRVVHKNDSTIISGIGQIRHDGINGKLRFGNGSYWYTPIGGDSLFWDETNQRLGVGTISPQADIHVYNFDSLCQVRIEGRQPTISFYDSLSVLGGSMGISGSNVSGVRGLFFRAPSSSSGVDNWFVARFGASNQKVFLGSDVTYSYIQGGKQLVFSSNVGNFGDTSATKHLIINTDGTLVGGADYSSSYTDTTYVQKTYVDNLVNATLQYAEVIISSAQVLDINSTPVTIIATPGTGKFIEVISIYGYLDYNTTTYATNFQLEFRYNNVSASITNTAWNIAQTEDKIFRFEISGTPTGEAISSIINQPITLSESSGNPTTGDGTLKVYITYRIVDL